MLRTSLITIGIAIVGLISINTVFGQWRPEDDRISRIKTTNLERKKTKGFQEISGIGMARRKHRRRTSAQYNPKEVGIGKTKPKKLVRSARDLDGQSAGRSKQPRKRTTQKQQHKPIQ